MSIPASNSERAMGFNPFKGVDVASLENEIEVLKTQARVAGQEIVGIFDPYAQQLLQIAKDISVYAVGATGMVGEFGARVLSTGRGRATTALLVFATGLTACGAASAEKPVVAPVTAGPEGSYLPTPDAKEAVGGKYPTESYYSSKLRFCAFHQFNLNGQPLSPIVTADCEITPDLQNHRVVVAGRPFASGERDVVSYQDEYGVGYESLQELSVEDVRIWVEKMNLTYVEKNQVMNVVAVASNRNVNVRVLMKTVLNIQKDANGTDKLVNMGLGLGFATEGDANNVAFLQDNLEPFTKIEALKDSQISAVDFVPQEGNLDQVVMAIYPSDWVESANNVWVSPEYVVLQDKIAAFGERFTLRNGAIEDGGVPIEALVVGLDGRVKLMVNGGEMEVATIDSTFDDEVFSVMSTNGNIWSTNDKGKSWSMSEPASGGVVSVEGGEILINGDPTPSAGENPGTAPDLTPEQLAELNKTTKLFGGAYTIDTYKDGGKTYATFTDAKTGETIPEIRIDANDPEQLSWSKVYEYRDHTIVIPQAMDKITVDSDGQVHFDFPGYVWKDGKFEPLIVEGQPVKNPAEAMVDLILDGDPTHTLLGLNELGNGDGYLKTGGFAKGEIKFLMYGMHWRGEGKLRMLNSDGIVSDITTTDFRIYNVKDARYPYQVLFFMGKDKKVRSILVDSSDIGWEKTKAWGGWGNFPEN